MTNDYVAAGAAAAAYSAGAQSQPTPEGGGLSRTTVTRTGCDATTEQGLLREKASEVTRDDEVAFLQREILELGKLLDEMELDNVVALESSDFMRRFESCRGRLEREIEKKKGEREDQARWLAEREQDAPSSSATMAAGEDPPQTRDNAPEGVDGQGQEPLSGKRQPPPRPGEAAQEEKGVGRHSVWGTQDNIILPAPERKPPDSHIEEKDTRTPETEGSLKPRTATRVGRARRERGSGGRTRVVGWGPARRLLWRTRTKRARVKEKHGETAGTGGWELMTGKFFVFLMIWFQS